MEERNEKDASHQERSQPSKVENPRSAKTRPPDSLRDHIRFHGILPKFSGPYSVGTMEIEVPAHEPRTFSRLRRHHEPLLKLETVLMTIYYPAAIGTGSGRDPSGKHKHWSRQTWLGRPRVSMAQGYGRFAGIGALAVPVFGATTMFTKLGYSFANISIPAFRNPSLANHWPPYENLEQAGPRVKNETGPPPKGEQAIPCFPLIVFSHGLGGSQTMYSSLCGEFASYGFVVCAVEHRDGSAARTIVNVPSHDGKVSHSKHIDYIFPLGNRRDTDPNNERGVDHELRYAQTDLRVAEIAEAFDVLRLICFGLGKEVARRNLRRKGHVGSSRGLDGIDWESWKGRFSLHQVTMMGHSFGSATVVEVLRQTSRFPRCAAGIILDAWTSAVKKESKSPISRPVLAINSEAFTYWPSNYDFVSSLVKEAQSQSLGWLMTIRGTVHVSQSDFALLYPRTVSWALKMTADPRRALDMNVNAILEFLQIVLPERMSQVNRGMHDEGLLQTPIKTKQDVPESDIHRPKQQWIAARLDIPHEARYRLDPRLVWQRRQRRKKQAGTYDLTGIGNPDGEIWMHIAPMEDRLAAFKRGELHSGDLEVEMGKHENAGMAEETGGKNQKQQGTEDKPENAEQPDSNCNLEKTQSDNENGVAESGDANGGFFGKWSRGPNR